MSSNLTTLMLLKSSLLRFCRCPVGRCSAICRRFATKLFTFGNLQHYIQLRTRGLKNSQLLIWGTTLMKYRVLGPEGQPATDIDPWNGVRRSAANNSSILPSKGRFMTVRTRAKAHTSQMPDWLLQPSLRGFNVFKATLSHWGNSVKYEKELLLWSLLSIKAFTTGLHVSLKLEEGVSDIYFGCIFSMASRHISFSAFSKHSGSKIQIAQLAQFKDVPNEQL